MTQPAVYESPDGDKIRVVMINGTPWFVALDVCAAAGIRNARMAVTRLDGADVSSTDVRNERGEIRPHNVITESGMYDLILTSRSARAKPFRKWVTGEVLPTLRQTGTYSVIPDSAVSDLVESDDYDAMLERVISTARAVQASRRQLAQHEARLTELTGEVSSHHGAIELHSRAIAGHGARLDSIEHNSDFYTILGWAKIRGIPMHNQMAAGIGRTLTSRFRHEHGQDPPSTRDQRFGTVFMYPSEWIDGVFADKGLTGG